MAKSQFNGEVLHFGAIRFRVTGSGNLKVSIKSLDEVVTNNLPNIVMTAATDREPLDLSNYVSQRGFVQLGTTEIDERFVISKIVIFLKPVSTGYPQ